MTYEERLDRIERDVQLIKKKLRKEVKERKMTLREKFLLHDHMRALETQFHEVASHIPDDLVFNWMIPTASPVIAFSRHNVKQELNRILNELIKMVDRALGAKP